MQLNLLGTGSTSAPPLFGCECSICTEARSDAQFRRLPACALIETEATRVLIDAGLMDLTDRFPAEKFPTLLLTHFHADHVQGLFNLRWGKGRKIPVYCPPDSEGCADLYKNPGLLDFRHLRKFEAFSVGPMTITPVPLIHSKTTLGFCFECGDRKIAYLTDTAGLPPRTEAFLRCWKASILVIDCSYPPSLDTPKNHNDLTRALAIVEAVRPRHTWLTHIGHELDAWLKHHRSTLPPAVSIARDGAMIDLGMDSNKR